MMKKLSFLKSVNGGRVLSMAKEQWDSKNNTNNSYVGFLVFTLIKGLGAEKWENFLQIQHLEFFETPTEIGVSYIPWQR